MKRFKIPAVGSVVTLTTRYRESYMYSDKEFRETAYEGVRVLKPEPWFKPGDFKISSDDPNMKFRVINIKNVCFVADGEEADVELTMGVVQVPGKKPGTFYDVSIHNGEATSCSCPGFMYRKQCRHLKVALDLFRETQREWDLCRKG